MRLIFRRHPQTPTGRPQGHHQSKGRMFSSKKHSQRNVLMYVFLKTARFSLCFFCSHFLVVYTNTLLASHYTLINFGGTARSLSRKTRLMAVWNEHSLIRRRASSDQSLDFLSHMYTCICRKHVYRFLHNLTRVVSRQHIACLWGHK